MKLTTREVTYLDHCVANSLEFKPRHFSNNCLPSAEAFTHHHSPIRLTHQEGVCQMDRSCCVAGNRLDS